MPDADLDRTTLRVPDTLVSQSVDAVTLTIAAHPQSERVGEQAPLGPLHEGGSVQLSRLSPSFQPPGGGEARPLADQFLSRKPVTLNLLPAGVQIVPDRPGLLAIGGEPLEDSRTLVREQLERGVVIELGGRVVLVLHNAPYPLRRHRDRHGLIGNSAAMEDLRAAISNVASLSVPVLILGETGSGKELVARALHGASTRAEAACICVNMGALSPSLAASELFGHVKGSFTGATRDHAGLFERADGGTLFLDEIGEAPEVVQPMLLRALETQEVEPLGGAPRGVDVRLVAATDADLERAIEEGSFRAALFHRLAGYVVQLPPLRHRREDIGILLHHFLLGALEEAGQPNYLQGTRTNETPWLPASVVALLCEHDWPGNVRQLRNIARQIVVSSLGRETAVLDDASSALLRRSRRAAGANRPLTDGEPRPEGLSPADEQLRSEVIEALTASRGNIAGAARTLGKARQQVQRWVKRFAIDPTKYKG